MRLTEATPAPLHLILELNLDKQKRVFLHARSVSALVAVVFGLSLSLAVIAIFAGARYGLRTSCSIGDQTKIFFFFSPFHHKQFSRFTISIMVSSVLASRAIPMAARSMRGVRFAHIENTFETAGTYFADK